MLRPYDEEKIKWDMVITEPCEMKVKLGNYSTTVEFPKRKIRFHLITKRTANFYQLKPYFCKFNSLIEEVLKLPKIDGLVRVSGTGSAIFDLKTKDLYENKDTDRAKRVFSLFRELVLITSMYSNSPAGRYKAQNKAVEKLVDGEFMTVYKDTIYYWTSSTREQSLKLIFLPLRGKILTIDTTVDENPIKSLEKYLNKVEDLLIPKMKENWEWIETFIVYLLI